MLPQDPATLASEYLQLWEESGVDGISERANPLANFLATPQAEPIAAETSEPCALCQGNHPGLPGEGNPAARVFFLSEGPAVKASEDLLSKILEAMKLTRDQIYLARLFSCTPPGSGAPEAEVLQRAFSEVQKRIQAQKPAIVIALGSTSTSTLLGPSAFLETVRGQWQPLTWAPDTVVMPTFHPAFLLRNADAKKPAWEDMKKVLAKLAGKL